MAQQVHHGHLTLASRFDEVASVRDRVTEAAQAHGFDESQIFGIKLALEEALTNAIKHGNAFDPDKSVTLDYQVDDEKLELTICDQGPGFEPDAVPDPTLDANLDQPCGRGVLLIQSYMTEIRYNKDGTCVTLVKRRDCDLPQT